MRNIPEYKAPKKFQQSSYKITTYTRGSLKTDTFCAFMLSRTLIFCMYGKNTIRQGTKKQVLCRFSNFSVCITYKSITKPTLGIEIILRQPKLNNRELAIFTYNYKLTSEK